MGFSDSSAPFPAPVMVIVDPGNDATVLIPPLAPAHVKRDLIAGALTAAGHVVQIPGIADPSLKIMNLPPGTQVHFLPGLTGEVRDLLTVPGALAGVVGFSGSFEPGSFEGRPAVFTAGIVTDVGELTAQVSAQELNFQTDGPIICQALFQRLAPRAPQYGSLINCAGDRLEIYFDPAYTVTQGGIIFGTDSSNGQGLGGTITVPQPAPPPCPTDLNGDGSTGLSDLSILLAAFGSNEGDAAYNPAADLNHDGRIGIEDLSMLLAQFGADCPE